MANSYKFKYVNEVAGFFVMAAVFLLVVGIILAGRAQHWFEPQIKVFTTFPPEGTFGLQAGAQVRILGALVGKVEEIDVTEDGAMKGLMTVRGDYKHFIRKDSAALIKKKYEVAGDAYILITAGQGAPAVNDDLEVTLPCQKDEELLELVKKTVDDFRREILPVIDNFEATIIEYGDLAANLNDYDRDIDLLMTNAISMVQGLEQGRGIAGMLLRDNGTVSETTNMLREVHTILTSVRTILADLQSTTDKLDMLREMHGILAQVHKILADIKKASEMLPGIAKKAGAEIQNASGIVLQTQKTLRETQVLVEGIQKNWLLRKYMDNSAPPERLPLTDIRK